MRQTKIKEEVLRILSMSEVKDAVIYLPSMQLDRKLYQSVNEILEAMGGKWNKKTKGHVFQADPTNQLEDVFLTGEIAKPSKNGYFPTPLKIVQRMIELAEIEPEMNVLEPSAGQGHIANELRKLDICLSVIEIMPGNRKILQDKGYHPIADNFLSYDYLEDEERFDRIIMNPPFERQADIDHVLHAYYLLADCGKLVSVMSSGVLFRENKKTTGFKRLLDEHGYYERNPEGSFKESGTMIDTIIIVMEK